jgi:NodT family efflux transporter outer membrane factor (OMF) lipoprotein
MNIQVPMLMNFAFFSKRKRQPKKDKEYGNMKVYEWQRRKPLKGSRHLLAGLMGAAVVLTAAGCMTVGPDYTPAVPDVPSRWHTGLEDGLKTGSVSLESMAGWWKHLNDDTLSGLEVRALEGSLDIRAARARLLEARALRGISRAGFFPTLNAGASLNEFRTSENGTAGFSSDGELYSLGFDAGWEVDLFGGVKRSVEAAQADLEAAEADLRDVLVSLQAEVALNYIEVRTYQARLASAEANIKAQEETYALTRSRYQAGMISELAMQQALYGLERSRAALPPLESGLASAKNRLAVLMGEQPGALHGLLAAPAPIPVLPPTFVVDVPAETLRNRPDIRRAERQLAAQTARVGVATADLYPKLNLLGSIGLESVSAGDFLDSGSRRWSVGPSASWSVFNAGAVRQNIAVQSARQEQALIQYEATVLQALEDVENVLTAYAKEQNRHTSLAAAVAAAKRADELAREQYTAGLVDFGNVLDSQRALLVLEDSLAQNEGTMVSNLVRLYKAFGGGWGDSGRGEEP